ncbi:hypothetical protein [uncultured Mucilaginibacter sp.]|nr:hypothetical protein [uncultured Mucilaginibacter sp.]
MTKHSYAIGLPEDALLYSKKIMGLDEEDYLQQQQAYFATVQ